MGFPDQEYPEYGEFPDVEQVCVDLLTPLIFTCTTLPISEEHGQPLVTEPLIWVQRTGGAVDGEEITDNAMVQFSIFTGTRKQSRRIASQARKLALGSAMTKVNGVLVDHVQETMGVLEMPELDPLNRMVQAAFIFSFRRQF